MRIFCSAFNFKPPKHRLFSFGTPVYLQLVLSSRNRSIKDVMSNSFLGLMCNHYLNRIILHALRFMNRNGVSSLKGNNGRVGIIVILIGATKLIDAK